MDWNHYRFDSHWTVEAEPGTVFGVLEDAEHYGRWWPQFGKVTRLTGTSVEIRVRSVLPYELVCVAEEKVRDRAAGVLESVLSRDMDGWARWTVTAGDGRTHVRYEQEVEVNKRLLRLLAVPGRPFFRLNHRLLMRAGQRGLRGHVAAYLK
jgi:hypothetical protein